MKKDKAFSWQGFHLEHQNLLNIFFYAKTKTYLQNGSIKFKQCVQMQTNFPGHNFL